MKALYVIGNVKLATVRAVAEAIRDTVGGTGRFSKLFIISTDASHNCYREQEALYFAILGEMRAEEVIIDIRRPDAQKRLADIFEEFDDRFVDLTNGQKPIASMLYMAASLCGINEMYYLMHNDDDTSSYIRMDRFRETNAFAAFSFYDLIYYSEDLDSIFPPALLVEGAFLHKTYHELKSAISDFFVHQNFKNAILSATIGNEAVIAEVFRYFENDPDARRFADAHNVYFGQRDPVGVISYLFKAYLSNVGREQGPRMQALSYIPALHDVPGLMSLLREFRNMAAHYSMHNHYLTFTEARLVINASLELYRTLQRHAPLWERLAQRSARV
ncbi:MAG: hypothetical protein IJ055_10755 [Oscillospiraceae bacterium]|nr:hypothetical protein [Oscillospiraceae bacterium]